MCFDNPAHDCEAESGALFVVGALGSGARVRLEQLVDFVSRDSLSLVRNRDRRRIRSALQRHRDGPARDGKLERVADQIVEYLLHTSRIDIQQGRRRSLTLKPQLAPLLVPEDRIESEVLRNQRRNVHRLQLVRAGPHRPW
jgi:hypothetical protein